MKDGSLAPVVAGLAVGVAFVVLLGASASGVGHWLWWPPPLPDWGYYAPLIQLKITGLNEEYKIGERVNFNVTQKSAGCVFPDTVAVKNLDTDSIVWQFNGTHASGLILGCPSMGNPADSSMTMNTEYEPPIIIEQTGSYVVIAEHQHKKVQQEFRVVD
jgi:hypothetical protein